VELGLLLTHGSLLLLLVLLLVGGLGVPIPEDLVLLAAGALSHRGGVSIYLSIGVCYLGVLGGDCLVFLSGRRLGSALLDRRMFRKLLTAERRRRIEGLFERRGAAVVFVARHTAGIRAPVFALAGMHGMPLGRFLFWDALGACVSVPVMTLLGFVTSQHVEQVARGVHQVGHWIAALVALAAAAYAITSVVRRARSVGP
jgi:membrane protein DedA with SNARE-associated domain